MRWAFSICSASYSDLTARMLDISVSNCGDAFMLMPLKIVLKRSKSDTVMPDSNMIFSTPKSYIICASCVLRLVRSIGSIPQDTRFPAAP